MVGRGFKADGKKSVEGGVGVGWKIKIQRKRFRENHKSLREKGMNVKVANL